MFTAWPGSSLQFFISFWPEATNNICLPQTSSVARRLLCFYCLVSFAFQIAAAVVHLLLLVKLFQNLETLRCRKSSRRSGSDLAVKFVLTQFPVELQGSFSAMASAKGRHSDHQGPQKECIKKPSTFLKLDFTMAANAPPNRFHWSKDEEARFFGSQEEVWH